MIKKYQKLAAFLLLVFLAGGCSSKGTEVVNPPNPSESVIGKRVLMIPETGSEVYQVTFFDEDTALSDQLSRTDFSVVLDTKGVSYAIDGDILRFTAAFDNGRQIGVTLGLDASGNILSLKLEVDGVLVGASFEVVNDGAPSPSPFCEVTVSDPEQALATVQALDVTLQPAKVVEAIAAGCAASSSNFEDFSAGFLCSLGIDPGLSADAALRNAIDNLEGVDDSDFLDGDASGATCP